MDAKELRPIKMIYAAFTAGASVFAVVAVGLAYFHAPTNPPNASQLHVANVISLGAGVVVLLLWKMARLIFRRMLTSTDAAAPPGAARLRQAYLIRLALYDAAAFVGLFAFLLDGLIGAFRQNPVYALTLTPFLTFITIAASTYPTPQSVQAVLERLRP